MECFVSYVPVPARMTIHIAKNANFEVLDSDTLSVHQQTHSITNVGEAQDKTFHCYGIGKRQNDSIKFSGASTLQADRELGCGVCICGKLIVVRGSSWITRKMRFRLKLGELIVVPVAVETVPKIIKWLSAAHANNQKAVSRCRSEHLPISH